MSQNGQLKKNVSFIHVVYSTIVLWSQRQRQINRNIQNFVSKTLVSTSYALKIDMKLE